MFTGGTRHLELLFEFGLGKGGDGVWFRRLGDQLGTPSEMLQQQMGWAAKYNQMARLRLLVERGVDVNTPDTRFRRPPYELAVLHGNKEVAQYLLDHGAKQPSFSDRDAFIAACLNADAPQARSLLAKDPAFVERLGDQRAELLNLAAEWNRPEAIRLMTDLGFDLNEVKRTAPLHGAAAAGNLDMVKLLLELGADPTLRDTEYNGTPRGWAEYNDRAEVAEFLKQLEPR
jgi:ankyrin repeat protein